MKGIDAIQQQYIYRVNPVNLFERREPNQTERSNIFASNNTAFNPTHPSVTGSGKGGSLDLLA